MQMNSHEIKGNTDNVCYYTALWNTRLWSVNPVSQFSESVQNLASRKNQYGMLNLNSKRHYVHVLPDCDRKLDGHMDADPAEDPGEEPPDVGAIGEGRLGQGHTVFLQEAGEFTALQVAQVTRDCYKALTLETVKQTAPYRNTHNIIDYMRFLTHLLYVEHPPSTPWRAVTIETKY